MMEYQRQLGFDAALSSPSTKDNDKHLHKEVDFLFALSPLLIKTWRT